MLRRVTLTARFSHGSSRYKPVTNSYSRNVCDRRLTSGIVTSESSGLETDRKPKTAQKLLEKKSVQSSDETFDLATTSFEFKNRIFDLRDKTRSRLTQKVSDRQYDQRLCRKSAQSFQKKPNGVSEGFYLLKMGPFVRLSGVGAIYKGLISVLNEPMLGKNL